MDSVFDKIVDLVYTKEVEEGIKKERNVYLEHSVFNDLIRERNLEFLKWDEHQIPTAITEIIMNIEGCTLFIKRVDECLID